MGDVSLMALLMRTIISLAVVLVIVAIAYRIAKRRANGTAPRSGGARPGTPTTLVGSLFGGARRATPAPIEVVGRIGLTRGAAAVAVRFGDRIVLVSATDQGPASVLAEMPGTEWDELTAVPETASPIITPVTSAGGGIVPNAPRPSFVEALRQATTRHG